MECIGEKDIEFIKEKKRVLEELLRSEQIELGQLINYAQFSNLYAPYKYAMNEREFAETLEITGSGFYGMKHGGKVGVLKNTQKELERIKEKQEIDAQGACIEMLNKYSELGFEREQALRNTEEMLGISPKEMLKIMQDYQAKQKKVEVVANEGIAFGE